MTAKGRKGRRDCRNRTLGVSTSFPPPILFRFVQFLILTLDYSVHLTTIHSLTMDDIPLLTHISAISQHLLAHSPSSSSQTHTGFSQPPFTNYMSRHLVAYAFSAEKTRWNVSDAWRFGAFAWWGVEEVVAEMRECDSNARVKTGARL
jgi:hypothetical protein